MFWWRVLSVRFSLFQPTYHMAVVCSTCGTRTNGTHSAHASLWTRNLCCFGCANWIKVTITWDFILEQTHKSVKCNYINELAGSITHGTTGAEESCLTRISSSVHRTITVRPNFVDSNQARVMRSCYYGSAEILSATVWVTTQKKETLRFSPLVISKRSLPYAAIVLRIGFQQACNAIAWQISVYSFIRYRIWSNRTLQLPESGLPTEILVITGH